MSTFLMLPDLILLEIMSYLTPMENLYSFFHRDNKLGCNNLLRESRHSTDIHLTFMFMTSKIFRHLCRNVFPFISSQIEFLKIDTDFVGNSIIDNLPYTIFYNLKSIHLHSLNEKNLIYILEKATQLKHLILGNVNSTSINLIFERYLHRLESFTCDNLLPVQKTFPQHPYQLTTLSISLTQLSLLTSFVRYMPQLKNLKIDLSDCDDVDRAERLRLSQMIKSNDIRTLATVQNFSFISYVKKIPWTIFVRLVKSMIGLRTLFFDYIVEWGLSFYDVRRYMEIDDENWNSSAANYLSTVLQSLTELTDVSFHLIISDCLEQLDKDRWKSSFWPKTSWKFDSKLLESYFYTLPWSKNFHYSSQSYDELDSMNINHSIKQCEIGPIIGQFARISQRFPKVQHLKILVQRSITSPPFHGIAQSFIHCSSLSVDESTPDFFLARILPYLPNLREVIMFGDIDQLFALATFRSSTIIMLSLTKWTNESIDFLREQYFPSLQHLSINLFEKVTDNEIEYLEQTIEQSFTHLPNLITLHYYNFKTMHNFSCAIQTNRYTHFFHVHKEESRVIIWK